jgi:hypothetical protein
LLEVEFFRVGFFGLGVFPSGVDDFALVPGAVTDVFGGETPAMG